MEGLGLISGLVKSGAVLPLARHRYDVSLEGDCSHAMTQRWAAYSLHALSQFGKNNED